MNTCQQCGTDLEHIKQLDRANFELLTSLQQALRYIEVSTAYRGAMTAAQVEEAIKTSHVSEVEIGANSCNTLARFNLDKARAAIAGAT